MKTDSLFYTLFLNHPGLVFELAGVLLPAEERPELATGLRRSADAAG